MTTLTPSAEARLQRKVPMSGWRVAVGILMVLLALAFLAPLAYMAFETFRNPSGSGLTLSNWRHVFSELPIGTGMKNSAILAACGSALTVLVTSTAGFAFAKLPFRGSRIVLFLVIMTLAFPLISAIVPEYLNLAKHGLIGSYLPAIVIYSAFNSAFAVVFFTSYFSSVPDAYIENAITEGAGYVTILWRIMLPMALPALITIGVFDFMLIWNDLLVALLFLPQPDHQTASVLLATINAGHSVHTQVLLAGSLLSVAPNLLVFLGFQRYLRLGYSIGVDK
jgi:ABC-type glycerol-3-phosphate transport system permease component